MLQSSSVEEEKKTLNGGCPVQNELAHIFQLCDLAGGKIICREWV
jgi:hypothetical protein